MLNYTLKKKAKKFPWKRSKVIWWPWKYRPTVYLSDLEDEATLAHEEGHVIQLWELGRWKFYTRWLFSKDHRLDLEAYCTARRIKFKIDGGGFEPEGLIKYYAALFPSSYRLKGFSPEKCEDAIRGHYNAMI